MAAAVAPVRAPAVWPTPIPTPIRVIPSEIGIWPIVAWGVVIRNDRAFVIIVIAPLDRRPLYDRPTIDITFVIAVEVCRLRGNGREANNGERREREDQGFHEDCSLEDCQEKTPLPVNGC
jgi:hypothetical protein